MGSNPIFSVFFLIFGRVSNEVAKLVSRSFSAERQRRSLKVKPRKTTTRIIKIQIIFQWLYRKEWLEPVNLLCCRKLRVSVASVVVIVRASNSHKQPRRIPSFPYFFWFSVEWATNRKSRVDFSRPKFYWIASLRSQWQWTRCVILSDSEEYWIKRLMKK